MAPVGAPPPGPVPQYPPTEIGDARALQGEADPAAFLAEHGFVLLPHATQVRDWDRDITDIYWAEIDAVIRERLLPGRRVEIQQAPTLLRRGRDTPVAFYAEGVHSDGGAGADDYAHNIGAFSNPEFARYWRARYDQDDVEALWWLDFWRPTNMSEPLEHMPLALCDVSSLDPADHVPTELTGIAPEGRPTRHLSLRFNAGQRWYSYPRMTNDELLVFKLAGFSKAGGPPQNCFHSAFRDPGARAGAQERQSCEHRVGVLLLRD
ncbi:CmcJ/NvfI family oxidoreductase [Sphingomonas caeni]|uniref:CmcJ/NvfI family oxidoreductase n=1 Tax=Sphingomonas caeni TaxID=2984949 RepID=UPI00222FE63E|nr:CmcJ/NvfI family oxidoreductase [Sphingomonas caeni]